MWERHQSPENSTGSPWKTPATKAGGILLESMDRCLTLRNRHTELQRPREVHNCQLQASVRKKPAHGALGWTSEGRRTHTWRRTLTNGCVFRGCTETGNGTTDKNGHILSLPKSRLIFMSPSNIEGKNSWKRKFNFVHLRGGELEMSGILSSICNSITLLQHHVLESSPSFSFLLHEMGQIIIIIIITTPPS